MSQENVEIVRAVCRRVESWRLGCHAQRRGSELRVRLLAVGRPGTWPFTASIRCEGTSREFVEAWESLRLEVDEFIEARRRTW